MSEENFDPSDDSDDLEMLEAIRAAFGDDAVDDMNNLNEDGPFDIANRSLDSLVSEIDKAALEGALEAESKQPKVQIEEDTQKFIVIELGETQFGIPMDNVYEIQRVPRVTFLPNVPEWIQGVANLRGNVVSVVNLKLLLGLENEDTGTTSQRLVVTQSLVDDVDSGLVVDRVIGIRSYPSNEIRKPTAQINSQIEPYLTGVVDSGSLIALLDVDKLLLSEGFRQFDAA